jgi:hypothetical protein
MRLVFLAQVASTFPKSISFKGNKNIQQVQYLHNV